MIKNTKNIYSQCLFFTCIWQMFLFTLYLANLITYNSLVELSDIVPIFFFIFFLSLIFFSPFFAFIFFFFIILNI